MATRHEQIVWAAGLIDGEACISIVRHSRNDRPQPHHGLRVDVAMVHKPTLLQLQLLFGGRIYPKRSKSKEHRQAWLWTIATQEAKQLLEQIRPFVLTKRKEVEIALAFDQLGKCAYPKGGVHSDLIEQRDALYHAIRQEKRYEYAEQVS